MRYSSIAMRWYNLQLRIFVRASCICNNLFSLALRIRSATDSVKDPWENIFHSGWFFSELLEYIRRQSAPRNAPRIRYGRRYKALIRKSVKSHLQDLWLRVSEYAYLNRKYAFHSSLPFSRSFSRIYFFRLKLCALIWRVEISSRQFSIEFISS